MIKRIKPFILHIETSGIICSVAISSGDELIALKESDSGKEHARQLSTFIDQLIKDTNIKYSDLNAVSVSKGPGSYTGLRIGIATAKGICFGLNIPLIAIDSLLSLTHIYLEKYNTDKHALYCPMIDARRMEVYTALFDYNMKQILDTQAVIIDGNSFQDILGKNKIVFFGDGAEKCKTTIIQPNALFVDSIQASARGLINEAFKAYESKLFENVAYFEPMYLKDFLINPSKKKII